MATSVRISNAAIISELNTPGGGVFEWRDEVATTAKKIAESTAPVNNPANARHRAAPVGKYKRSFDWDRIGSNGHKVRATIYNDAPHARFVELGRSASNRYQRFSWTGWGGEIRTTRTTRRREGQHILERALQAAWAAFG